MSALIFDSGTATISGYFYRYTAQCWTHIFHNLSLQIRLLSCRGGLTHHQSSQTQKWTQADHRIVSWFSGRLWPDFVANWHRRSFDDDLLKVDKIPPTSAPGSGRQKTERTINCHRVRMVVWMAAASNGTGRRVWDMREPSGIGTWRSRLTLRQIQAPGSWSFDSTSCNWERI